MKIKIELIADMICPWCHIGREKLSQALKGFPDARVELRWYPFELNPTMPKEGMSRKAFRSMRFGSWEQSQAMDARAVQAGEALGLKFDYSIQHVTPNTFESHRLLAFGRRLDLEDVLARKVLKAYFEEGVDIGNVGNLIKIASTCGLSEEVMRGFFASQDLIHDVRRELKEVSQQGISSVPTYRVNGQVLPSARDPAELLGFIKGALSLSDVTV